MKGLGFLFTEKGKKDKREFAWTHAAKLFFSLFLTLPLSIYYLCFLSAVSLTVTHETNQKKFMKRSIGLVADE